MEKTDQLLQMINASPKIDSDIALLEKMIKKTKVRELINSGRHKYAVTTLKSGVMQTYVIDPVTGKRKGIQGRTEAALYNALYEFYYGDIKRIRMCDLFEDWLKDREEYNLSPRTIRRYTNSYETYLKGTELDITPISKITSKQCSDFFNKLIRDNNLTIKQYCNVVVIPNKLFRFAVSKEIITESPMEKAVINTRACRNKPNLKTSERIYYTDEKNAFLAELRNMISQDELSDYYAIALIWKLALRIGEIVALKWTDIDYQAMELHIQRMESRDRNNKPCIVEHCKGNSPYAERRLPLSDYELEILEHVREFNYDNGYHSEYIFMGYNYKTEKVERRTIKNIDSSIRRICKKACIPEKSAHDIRRTVASELFKSGETLESIRALLGHADIKTTAEYIVDIRTNTERGARLHKILESNEILENEEAKVVDISLHKCKSRSRSANT